MESSFILNTEIIDTKIESSFILNTDQFKWLLVSFTILCQKIQHFRFLFIFSTERLGPEVKVQIEGHKQNSVD